MVKIAGNGGLVKVKKDGPIFRYFPTFEAAKLYAIEHALYRFRLRQQEVAAAVHREGAARYMLETIRLFTHAEANISYRDFWEEFNRMLNESRSEYA